jgi:hypothetical protein
MIAGHACLAIGSLAGLLHSGAGPHDRSPEPPGFVNSVTFSDNTTLAALGLNGPGVWAQSRFRYPGTANLFGTTARMGDLTK